MSNQDINIENSVFGISPFDDEIFLNQNDTSTPIQNGVYYSKIFLKNEYEIWSKLYWTDNQNSSTFNNIKISVTTRTGNSLPINYSTNKPYTLNEINSLIVSSDNNTIDSIFQRATLGRSSISSEDSIFVNSNPESLQNLGTSENSFRINNNDNFLWTSWSLPILSSPSYIPNNINNNYLQARIVLESFDRVTLPEVFRINFTSTLKL